MLLIIDNYDSFTYNLVQYFGEMGAQMEIHRNDQITLEEIAKKNPDHICISPGPCTPKEAGISCAVIERFGRNTPILGVCLGHQSIGHVFGGDVVRAGRLMHGKTSQLSHANQSVFKGLPNPFTVIRYHSLAIERHSLPASLQVTAQTDDGEIMGVMHKTLPIHGVQFHPESSFTEHGHALLKNFLDLVPG